MNTFVVTSETNYGIGFHIVNADTEEGAKRMAIKEGAWDDCTVTKINTVDKGIVHYEF